MRSVSVTSRDVARLAGVSQSAVSRVFTPGASASERMARRVRRAAATLGYRPNSLARGLITGRSRMIGIVVAYLDNQFYPLAVEKLSKALQARGYHALVFMSSNVGESVKDVVSDMLDYQLDGIIMASVSISGSLADRCRAAGLPVVLFNRVQHGRAFSSVSSDNVRGGRRVADFLVACGHRRIAHISGWKRSSTGRDREAGLRQGLAQHGLEPVACVDGRYDRLTAMRLTRELFDVTEPPEALFVGNDHMAFAALDVLRYELQLAVPQDVAVVGYDDTPLASWPAYNLTTVRQRVNHMVDATVDTLLARIEQGEQKPVHVLVDGPLIPRGTTRSPACSFRNKFAYEQ